MQRQLDGDSLYLAVRKMAGRLAGRVQDEDRKTDRGRSAKRGRDLDHQRRDRLLGRATIPASRLQRELPLQATASGFGPSHTKVVPGSNDATVILKRSP